MWGRKKKSFFTDLIFSKFFLILGVILFLSVLFVLAKGTIKNYQVDSNIKDLQNQISHLEGQNQEFSQLLDYLKSDTFVEQEAKLKLGYKKPGENLVIIPQDQLVNAPASENNKIETFNPARWWNYFFK